MKTLADLLREGTNQGGAVTANPRQMRLADLNRAAYRRPETTGASGALQFGAGVLGAVPVVGDLFGFANDVNQMRANPEQRTPINMGLAALGLIPFVPPAVSFGLGKLAQARGVNIGPQPGSVAAAAPSQRGAIVYHGSPHRFDRFDSSKIGTGEGAQMYGHGLYLAETPDVAKAYQPRDPAFEQKIMRQYSAAERSQNYPAMQVYEDFLLHKTPADIKVAEYGYEGAELAKAQAAYNAAKREYEKQAAGALYTVDLPDPMIARMLDWDKPLSQQGAIQQAFGAKGASTDPLPVMRGWNTGGANTWDALVKEAGGQDRAAQRLRALGIPGIRYLDGGSRGSGQGTSNFVVFPGEESNLRILERNGQRLADLLRR